MSSEETARGLQYFKEIIESGKSLRFTEPRPINQGLAYLMEIKSLNKDWYFTLTREQVDDLPGTKDHYSSADALARSLDQRFKNVDPNLFVTRSGRLVRIKIEWPAFPWITPNGFAAASGAWVSIADLGSLNVAKCIVQMTHMQTMPRWGSNPYNRPAQIINTIRFHIDAGTIEFYANENELPKEFFPTKFQTSDYSTSQPSIEEYLAYKVWLLGFVAGTGEKQIKAWIADPWDADYLGCTVADLRRIAAVLDAQERIILDEDSEFASVGKVLLAANGPMRSANEPQKPTFRTALSTYLPDKNLGEGGSGKVLLVSDQNGDKFALKYLKPDVQTERRPKDLRTNSISVHGIHTRTSSRLKITDVPRSLDRKFRFT